MNRFVRCSFLFSLLLCYHVTKSELYAGSPCIHKQTNKQGVCKYFSQCPEAIIDLRKGIYPQNCGFEGTQSIVCCVLAEQDTSTRPTTTSTTTATTTLSTTTTVSTTTVTTGGSIVNRLPGEVARQKCNIYKNYVWTVEASPLLVVGAEDIRTSDCPFDREQLVVGGTPAQRREFPHMVQVGYDEDSDISWSCGGSLISDRFVLTAAHCLEDRSKGTAEHVRMGYVNVNDISHVQQYRVIDRIFHPGYEEPAHYNDIGLLKMDRSATLNTWVRPACIHTEYSVPYKNSIASGWGKTEFSGPESDYLLKVVLQLYEQPKCNYTYRSQAGSNKLPHGIDYDVMVCAGSTTEQKDTCQGDSGGPLQIYRGENKDDACVYVVIGITSFGKGCGLAKDIPGVYTRVSHYVKWIEDYVWPA